MPYKCPHFTSQPSTTPSLLCKAAFSLSFKPKSCICYLPCTCTLASPRPAVPRLPSLRGAVGSVVTASAALALGHGLVGFWLCVMRRPDPVIHTGRLAARVSEARGCFWRYTYAQLVCCRLCQLSYLVLPDSGECVWGHDKQTRAKSCKIS